jgi:predicted RNA binding protein YcfA (HicA-like mRNA interferase family)
MGSRQLLKGLRTLGFEVVNIEGSHAKLRRASASGPQTLTVPLHATLQTGTLLAIYRQVRRYASEEDARPLFYA